MTRSPIELFWTAKERKSGLKVCNCALHDIDTLHSHAVTLLASQCFNWFQILPFLWIFLTFLILALVSDVFRIEVDNYGEEQNTDSALNQRLEEADC